MLNIIKILPQFTTSGTRSLERLKERYENREKLQADIRELMGDEFLWGLQGKKIFMKPNWVRHSLVETDEICLRTHDEFILAALEIVLKQQVKEVTVGDAPVQGCDWECMHSAAFLRAIEELGNKYNTPVKVKDFRRTIYSPITNKKQEKEAPMSDYLIFNVGNRSFLEDITGKGNFRITCYPPERLLKEHYKGHHCYCIVKELFEADVVISLPKVKTHQKTGITAALKNLVGINGDKDYLPHHRIGGTKFGGDCYPGGNVLRRTYEALMDIANHYRGKKVYWLFQKMSAICWKLSFPSNVHQRAAGWYGNDTCWRMVMDLNLIIKYGRKDGTLADVPQREIWSLCDGVIGGQGNGPLNPKPLPLGIISFSNSSPLNDVCICKLMGFDPEHISLIAAAHRQIQQDDNHILWKGKEVSLDELEQYAVETRPSPGWEDFLYRKIINKDNKR